MATGKTFQSNHLEKVIDYDSSTGRLVLEFVGGQRYSYQGVGFRTYHDLCQSSSPGTFFHKNINGKFDHAKLTK